MNKRVNSKSILLAGMMALILTAVIPGLMTNSQEMPFGGKDDIAFGEKLWKAMDGYTDWKLSTDYYPGRSPHGQFLRTYYNILNIDGKNYHVVVKDNFAGDNLTMEMLKKSPVDHLVAVTVMVQREVGYDPDNDNWYWVKYKKDGSIEQNPKGMALAGRVAKGSDSGCIACHANAKGDDYFFTND